MQPVTQYIFFDESGKPEIYSSNGTNLVTAGTATKFLILAAIRSNDQLLLQQQITEFRLSLLKDPSLTNIFSPSYGLDSFSCANGLSSSKRKIFNFYYNFGY